MDAPHGDPWSTTDFAVVDVETNGFSPDDHDIIELAIVHLDGRRLVFDSLLQPRRRIGNRDIHGISNRDVRSAPTLASVAGTICDLLVGRILVAHNAAFDVSFLRRALGVEVPYLCTMDLHTAVTGFRRDLALACAEASVSAPRARHHAREDAMACALLLEAHLHRLDLRGIRSASALTALHPEFDASTREPLTLDAARTVAGRGALKSRASGAASQ